MTAANFLFGTELGKFSQAIQLRGKFTKSIEVFSEGKLPMLPLFRDLGLGAGHLQFDFCIQPTRRKGTATRHQ